VERMLLQSARDVDIPGKDQHSGYGILDAAAALKADPRFYIITEITGVKVVQEGSEAKVQVMGTADADRFKSAYLELGPGKKPTQWNKVSQDLVQPVRKGMLGAIPASALRGSAEWTVRLIVQHQNGKGRETWYYLKLQ